MTTDDTGKTRDSKKTRDRILNAVEEILATKGFKGLGINSIAREAGVDKVLIYRYFGGLEGLLEAFSARGGFWPEISLPAREDNKELEKLNVGELVAALLNDHPRKIRTLPITREIMRRELLEKNNLTRKIGDKREKQGLELLELLSFKTQKSPGVDIPAVFALVRAGLDYLALLSDTNEVYLSMDLNSEAGWKRIGNAAIEILAGALSGDESRPQIPKKDISLTKGSGTTKML